MAKQGNDAEAEAVLGQTPWNNFFVAKFVFVLILSGLLSGYSTGNVSVLGLLLSSGQVVSFDIFGAG